MDLMEKNMIGFSEEELNKVFPHFIILNRDLSIEKYGKGIYKLFPKIKTEVLFFDQFKVQRPMIKSFEPNEFHNILSKLIIFSSKNKKELLFKGHFELLESIGKYVFFGTLALNSTSQLQQHKIEISDFAFNDSLVDLLYVIKNNEIVNSELNELVKDLNSKKNDLELFQNIINSTSDAIQVAKESGQMLYINSESSRRLGIPEEEIQNYSVLDFEKAFKNDINLWNDHIEVLKTNDYLTIEGSNLNRITGEYFPVEVTVKYLKFGGVGHAVAVSRDISERKINEKNLKLQEEKYRNIISNMNLGLLEVDINGKVIMCNSSFEKISGYTLEELLGKDAAGVFGKGETQNVLKEKVELRKKGNTDSYEVLIKNKRGEARWWLVSGATNFNDEGKMIGSVGIHLDVTDQKNLEQDLEEALIKSQQASKSKEAFLANMSHEIRTPLNGILGMIQALKAEKLNKEQDNYVHSAYIASEHLLSIINNVLDITKIEAGELELIKKSFSLTKVINDIETILRNQVNKENISLSTEINDIKSFLVGDEARLRQILINILGNAIKFTEKGSVKLVCKGSISENGKQDIQIDVIDTGIGIDEKAIGSMFQKFHQEDASISRKFGGSGLGLVITKELIELMDGSIDLKSKKGTGTTIIIKLSLPIGEENTIVEDNVFKKFDDLKGKRILLVEDNDMNRLVVKHSLAQTKVLLTEVINGKEAIDSLKENEFDLILMDVQMPIMGGMEATELIRNELKLETPIIALSANAFKSEIDACLAIGFNDYIIKPFDRNTLLKAIHRFSVSKDNESVLEEIVKTPIYNLEELNTMAMGNQEFIQSMIQLFIEIVPQSMKEIDDAYALNDFSTIKKVAHRIKPSIDNMGILNLKETIRHLEKYDIDSNDINHLDSLIYEVRTTLSNVVLQLEQAELN